MRRELFEFMLEDRWAFAQVGLMPGAVMLSLGAVASYMSTPRGCHTTVLCPHRQNRFSDVLFPNSSWPSRIRWRMHRAIADGFWLPAAAVGVRQRSSRGLKMLANSGYATSKTNYTEVPARSCRTRLDPTHPFRSLRSRGSSPFGVVSDVSASRSASDTWRRVGE